MKEPGYHTRSLILQRPAKVSGEVDRTQPEICVGQILIAESTPPPLLQAGFFVASGLAPRWAAQRPQNLTTRPV